MVYSNECVRLVKQYEGLYLNAYRCSSDVLTIGYGHTNGVYVGMEIDVETAEKYLKSDLDEALHYVEYYAKKYGFTFNQCQVDSLVSFTFNCGCGSLNKILGSVTNIFDIPNKMLNFTKNKYGVVLSGLVKRRKDEIALFKKGGVYVYSVIKKGYKGLNVRVLQTLLQIESDGVFGQLTYVAVVNYQRNNNLYVDGVVGAKTWESLLKKGGVYNGY